MTVTQLHPEPEDTWADPSIDHILGEACWSTETALRVLAELPPIEVGRERTNLLTALRGLVEDGAPITPDVVMARVTLDRRLDWHQTLRLMPELTVGGTNGATVGYHLSLVQDAYARQQVVALGALAQQVGNGDPADAIATVRDRLDKITTRAIAAPPTVAELLDEHLELLETADTTRTIGTGLTDLDHLLGGGFRPGQLVVVGAQSSVGKSILLASFARHAAMREGEVTVIHSLEMSRDEIMDRIVSAEAKVDLTRIISRSTEDADWSRIVSRVEALGQGRLHIDDSPGRTVGEIRSTCAPLRPSMIVVDYLQLMTPERGDNRQEQISGLSRRLKNLARELGCVVATAVQLNRAAEGRTDKRPRLADVRESAGPVHDADVVMLIDRDPTDETGGTTAELIVAKNRNGPTGSVDLVFAGHYARFDSAAWTPSRMAS